MTDPAAHTPDVDALVAEISEAHHAVRLAAPSLPLSKQLDGADAALSDLAAIARERDFQENRYKQEHRTRNAMEDEISRLARRVAVLEAAAEDVVLATVPVLPLTGSLNTGYAASNSTQTTYVALVEEWRDATEAVARLDALRHGAALDGDGGGA